MDAWLSKPREEQVIERLIRLIPSCRVIGLHSLSGVIIRVSEWGPKGQIKSLLVLDSTLL